jgi:hypothetical protein
VEQKLLCFSLVALTWACGSRTTLDGSEHQAPQPDADEEEALECWQVPGDAVTVSAPDTFELGLHTYSTEPCNDWDLATAPSWSEPSAEVAVQWRRSAAPGYSFVVAAVGMDGTLWVVEENRLLTQPAARVLVFDSRGARLASSPLFCGWLGYPIILPDGTALVDLDPDRSAEGTSLFLRLDSRAQVLGAVRLPEYLDVARLEDANGMLVSSLPPTPFIGPGGRLYFSTRDGVAAVCQDGRLLWRHVLRDPFYVAELNQWEPRGATSLVSMDGSIWASGTYHMPLRLTPDGAVAEELEIPADPSENLISLVYFSDRYRVARARPTYPIGSITPDQVYMFDEASIDGEPSVLSVERGSIMFDATGGVWHLDANEPVLARYVDQEQVFLHAWAFDFVWPVVGEDASMLLVRSDPEQPIVRILPDGTEAWRIPLRSEEAPRRGEGLAWGTLVARPDGMVFAATEDLLVAVQTDVAVYAGRDCVHAACNMRRNRWAGSP